MLRARTVAGHLPGGSPIEPLTLSRPLPALRRLDLPDARGRLWVIDDGSSGDLYGGNKIRKLDWLLAEAKRDDVRDLLVFGADGSHYVLATARVAATLGMKTHALQFRQPMTPHVAEVCAATRRCAASVTDVSGVAGPSRALRAAVDIWRHTGRWPRLMPLGGSSGCGSVGWLLAGRALLSRIETGQLEAPRRIIVALGSGGTLAGLAGSGLPGLVGVRVTPRWLAASRRVRRLARQAQQIAGAEVPIRFEIDHRWYCGGYGRWDERIVSAVGQGVALDLPLELTYTGKAFAAALSCVEQDAGDVWFIQTASRLP